MLAAFRCRCLRGERRSVNPTTVFIHGNATGSDMAVRQGWSLYSRCGTSPPAVPSAWLFGRGRPTELCAASGPTCSSKSRTAIPESYYLARTLPSVTAGTPVSLVGYSLGCRIAGGLATSGRRPGGRPSPITRSDRRMDDRNIAARILRAGAIFLFSRRLGRRPECPCGEARMAGRQRRRSTRWFKARPGGTAFILWPRLTGVCIRSPAISILATRSLRGLMLPGSLGGRPS